MMIAGTKTEIAGGERERVANRNALLPLMMDFMSHLVESMLCRATRSSPGVRGDMEELPSPLGRGEEERREEGKERGGDRRGGGGWLWHCLSALSFCTKWSSVHTPELKPNRQHYIQNRCIRYNYPKIKVGYTKIHIQMHTFGHKILTLLK